MIQAKKSDNPLVKECDNVTLEAVGGNIVGVGMIARRLGGSYVNRNEAEVIDNSLRMCDLAIQVVVNRNKTANDIELEKELKVVDGAGS